MRNYENEYFEFSKRFVTEAHCRDYLFRLRWPERFRCPKCGYYKKYDLSPIKYKCTRCRHQTSLIYGTIFQGTHQPLTRWFRAIWYVTLGSDQTNASDLQKFLDLGSYHTALDWWRKLRKIMFQFHGVVTFDTFMQNIVDLQSIPYEETLYDDYCEEI